MLQFKSSQKSRLGALLALSVAISISSALPAHAADDASMDSIWMDQKASNGAPVPAGSTVPQNTAPASVPVRTAAPTPSSTVSDTMPVSPAASTSSASAALTPSETRAPLETAAPMCSLNEFKNSSLVSKGGWPGVGPFKSDGNEFADDHQNRVHVDLSTEQQLTRAEMTLANKQLSGNQQRDLLDMQMNIDFLLEAVGIKAKKIAEFNSEIEKSKDSLLRNDQSPVNLVAGRISVNVEKRPAAQSGLDYVVVVNSLDANKKVLKQHSLSEEPAPPKKQAVAMNNDARYIFEENSAPTQPAAEHPARIAVKPTTSSANPGGDAITYGTSSTSKESFANVIADWQKIKRGAVKTRQTEDLAAILSGKALARQMDAIKWLVTNKKFYDMTPKGVVVDQFTEIVPAKKFAVLAQVREAYKFIDEPSGKVIKEVDDVNRVNYTIEKIGGKWLITDSSLLSTASSNGRTASTANKTH